MTARVKTLEEGQYKLFNILEEIQEWWEAQAIVAVIGQNASVDSEEDDIEEMEHEDGAKIVPEIMARSRAQSAVLAAPQSAPLSVPLAGPGFGLGSGLAALIRCPGQGPGEDLTLTLTLTLSLSLPPGQGQGEERRDHPARRLRHLLQVRRGRHDRDGHQGALTRARARARSLALILTLIHP